MSTKFEELPGLPKILITMVVAPILAFPFTALTIPFTLMNAWGIFLYYEWFIRPPGAPFLSFWHVVGLVFLWIIIRNKSISNDKEKMADAYVKSIVKASVVLVLIVIGSVIKGWI